MTLLRVALWPPMVLLILLLILLGWIVIPIAVLFEAYAITGVTNHGGDKWGFTWRWVDYIFGNREDGICEGWQYRKKRHSVPNQIIYWSCLRNPAGGLRWIPYLSCKIKSHEVYFFGSFCKFQPEHHETEVHLNTFWQSQIERYDTRESQWFFAYCGWYSNFFWQFNLFGIRRLWIGWKIMPADIYEVSAYRREGAGFALQFKRVK